MVGWITFLERDMKTARHSDKVVWWQMGRTAQRRGYDVATMASEIACAGPRQLFLDGAEGKPRPRVRPVRTFEVRATCTERNMDNQLWIGKSRSAAEAALTRMQAECGYAWTNWRIIETTP